MKLKEEQGSVSIMLAILFFVFILVAATMIDAARIAVASAQLDRAAASAARSVLSEYDYTLKEEYGLFGYDASNPDAMKTKLSEYVNRQLDPSVNLRKGNIFYQAGYLYDKGNFIDIAGTAFSDPFITDRKDAMWPQLNTLGSYMNTSASLVTEKSISLEETELFKKQILDYMKFRGPMQVVDEFLSKLEVVMKAGSTSEVAQDKIKVDQSLADLQTQIYEIIYQTDGWKFSDKGDLAVNSKNPGSFVKQFQLPEGSVNYVTDSKIGASLAAVSVKDTDGSTRIEQQIHFAGMNAATYKVVLDDNTVRLINNYKNSIDTYFSMLLKEDLKDITRRYCISVIKSHLENLLLVSDGYYTTQKNNFQGSLNAAIAEKDRLQNAIPPGDTSEVQKDIDRYRTEVNKYTKKLSQMDEIAGLSNKDEAATRYADGEFIEDIDNQYDNTVVKNCCRYYQSNKRNDASLQDQLETVGSYYESISENIGLYSAINKDTAQKIQTFLNSSEAVIEQLNALQTKADGMKDDMLLDYYDEIQRYVDTQKNSLTSIDTIGADKSKKTADVGFQAAKTKMESNGAVLDKALTDFTRINSSIQSEQQSIYDTTFSQDMPDFIDADPYTFESEINKINSLYGKQGLDPALDGMYDGALSAASEGTQKINDFISKINTVIFDQITVLKDSLSSLNAGYKVDILYNNDYKPVSENAPAQGASNVKKNQDLDDSVKKKVINDAKTQTDDQIAASDYNGEKDEGPGIIIPDFQKRVVQTTTASSQMFEVPNLNPDDDKASNDNMSGLLSKLVSNIKTFILNAGEAILEEVYVNEYIMNMFNSGVDTTIKKNDGSEALTKKGIVLRENLKNEPIVDNLSNQVMDSQIEYVIYGKENDKANYDMACVTILAIRTAMNFLHLYIDPVKRNTTFVIATAIAGWWTGGLGIPIMQAIIAAGWALIEANVDLYALKRGESVAFYKSAADWKTSLDGIIRTAGEEVANEAINKAAEVVSGYAKSGVERIRTALQKELDARINGLAKDIKDIAEESIRNYKLELDNLIAENVQSLDNAIKEVVNVAADAIVMKGDQINSGVNSLQAAIGEEVSRIIDDVFNNGLRIDTAIRETIKNQIYQYLSDNFDYIRSLAGTVQERAIDFSKKASDGLIKGILESYTAQLEDKAVKALDDFITNIETEAKNLVTTSLDKAEDYVDTAIDNGVRTLSDIGKDKARSLLLSYTKKMKLNISSTNIANGITNKKSLVSSIRFSYNDYLRLFLLFTDDTEKLRRTADLIQGNVRLIKGNDVLQEQTVEGGKEKEIVAAPRSSSGGNFLFSNHDATCTVSASAKLNMIFLDIMYIPDTVQNLAKEGFYEVKVSSYDMY